MYATDLETLYEAVQTPGGLSRRVRLEALVGDLQAQVGDGHFEPLPSGPRSGSTVPSPRRAEDLSSGAAVATAHGMGIHRWQGRAELNGLIDGWPCVDAHDRDTVQP